MKYVFQLSDFLDKLRKNNRINYGDYVKYRGIADTLAMENDRLKDCERKYNTLRTAYVTFFEELSNNDELMNKFIKANWGGKLKMLEDIINSIEKEAE